MKYYRHIEACNPPIEEVFWPWYVDGLAVGWLRPAFASELSRFADIFDVRDRALHLDPGLQGFEARSGAIEQAARALSAAGVTPPFMDEPYAVTPAGRESALCGPYPGRTSP